MNAIRTLRSRSVRLLCLVAMFVAALVVPAQAAFAQVAPPEGPATAVSPAVSTPTVITHAVSNSGLAIWAVVLIAVAAVAIGAGLRELVLVLSRRVQVRRLATTESY